MSFSMIAGHCDEKCLAVTLFIYCTFKQPAGMYSVKCTVFKAAEYCTVDLQANKHKTFTVMSYISKLVLYSIYIQCKIIYSK